MLPLAPFALAVATLALALCSQCARAASAPPPLFDVLTCVDGQPFTSAAVRVCPAIICSSDHMAASLLMHLRERFVALAMGIARSTFSCLALPFAIADTKPALAAELSQLTYRVANVSLHHGVCYCNFASAISTCFTNTPVTRWLFLGDATFRHLVDFITRLCERTIAATRPAAHDGAASRYYRLSESQSITLPSPQWAPSVVFVNVGVRTLALPPLRPSDVDNTNFEALLEQAMNSFAERFPDSTLVWVSSNAICHTAFTDDDRCVIESILHTANASRLHELGQWITPDKAWSTGLSMLMTSHGAINLNRRAARLLRVRVPRVRVLDLTPLTLYACDSTPLGDGRAYPQLDVIKVIMLRNFGRPLA